MKSGELRGALTILVALALPPLSCNGSLDFAPPKRGSGGLPGSGGAAGTGTGGASAGGVGASSVGGRMGASGGISGGGAVGGESPATGGMPASAGGSAGGGGGGDGGVTGSGGIPGTCSGDANCNYALHCDASNSQTCVECVQDLNCAGKPATPYCNLVLNRCVACVPNVPSQCPAGICVQNLCAKTCPGGSAAGCPASAPRCEDAADGAASVSVCSSCDDDVPCPAGLSCLLSARACVGCINDSKCNTPGLPRCDPALHRCVQCTRTADCLTPAAPLCDVATGVCRPP